MLPPPHAASEPVDVLLRDSALLCIVGLHSPLLFLCFAFFLFTCLEYFLLTTLRL